MAATCEAHKWRARWGRGMTAARITVSLDEATADILTRFGSGNVSRYISVLLRRGWQEWQAALADLRSAGWADAKITAACQHLNGVHDRGAAAVIAVLQGQMTVTPEEADHLARLAAEWWAGNEALRLALLINDDRDIRRAVKAKDAAEVRAAIGRASRKRKPKT